MYDVSRERFLIYKAAMVFYRDDWNIYNQVKAPYSITTDLKQHF